MSFSAPRDDPFSPVPNSAHILCRRAAFVVGLDDAIVGCCGKIIREILPQRHLAGGDSNMAVTDVENDIAVTMTS